MGNVEAKQEGVADGVALMQAAQTGDVAGMEALLKKNPALMYAHSKEGETVWHFAARGGHVQVLHAFHAAVGDALQHQKRPDKLINQVNHAFNAVNVTVNSITQLPNQLAIPMSKDVSINAPTRQGITPLMAAVQCGQVDALKFLLAHGADAWTADARGSVAMHHAAAQADAACLLVLIAHADKIEAADLDAMDRMVNARNNAGLTPVHFAAWSGTCDCLKLLVNHGALFRMATSADSLGDISCNAGSTPLHLAAMKGDVKTIRLLLRAFSKLCAMERSSGAAVLPVDMRAIKDRYGKTPRDIAVDAGRRDVAELLDPQTPLGAAVQATSKTAGSEPRSRKVEQSASMHKSTAGTDAASAGASSGNSSAQGASRKASSITAPPGSSLSSTLAAEHARAEQAAPAAHPAGSSTNAVKLDGNGSHSVTGSVGCSPAAALPEGVEPPEDMLCPLTNELMKDPVVAGDGHSYERSAIEVWFELGNTSFPGGHTRITHTRLTPDEALRARIAAWKMQQHY